MCLSLSCLTLRPHGLLPGSSIHGILQVGIPDWVAVSSSRGSSQPRDWTWVSWIAGRFFAIWTTREAHSYLRLLDSEGRKKKSLIDWMTDVSSHNILALLPLINSFIKFKIMVYILKILIHNFCSVFNPTNPSDFSTLQKIVNIALWRILSQVLRFFQTILLVPY